MDVLSDSVARSSACWARTLSIAVSTSHSASVMYKTASCASKPACLVAEPTRSNKTAVSLTETAISSSSVPRGTFAKAGAATFKASCMSVSRFPGRRASVACVLRFVQCGPRSENSASDSVRESLERTIYLISLHIPLCQIQLLVEASLAGNGSLSVIQSSVDVGWSR